MSVYGDDRRMVDQFPCPVCGRVHMELELKRLPNGDYKGLCHTRRRPFVVHPDGKMVRDHDHADAP